MDASQARGLSAAHDAKVEAARARVEPAVQRYLQAMHAQISEDAGRGSTESLCLSSEDFLRDWADYEITCEAIRRSLEAILKSEGYKVTEALVYHHPVCEFPEIKFRVRW